MVSPVGFLPPAAKFTIRYWFHPGAPFVSLQRAVAAVGGDGRQSFHGVTLSDEIALEP